MSSGDYYRVDRDRVHRCAESLVEQGFPPGDALQVALMQEVALALTDILGPEECGNVGALIDLSVWPRRIWRD